MTKDQATEQKAAVDAMKNAKANIQLVLDRHTALALELEKWILLANDLKKYVPDMFETKHHDTTPLGKLQMRINSSKTIL